MLLHDVFLKIKDFAREKSFVNVLFMYKEVIWAPYTYRMNKTGIN
jgi:hypothetical protein